MAVDDSALDLIALSRSEYELIVERLGREPNEVELGMFGALWSEHCGYKHSALLLRRLPSEGPRVLQGPGENAGVLDLGDGLAVAFKVESHNHPSAVEPFQGAATGVGGIATTFPNTVAAPLIVPATVTLTSKTPGLPGVTVPSAGRGCETCNCVISTSPTGSVTGIPK